MPDAVPNNVATKAKVFISYSRKDMAFADKLDAALKARGYEPLIDREEIYAFEDWWERIQSLIAQADTIIFVLSPDAVASDICAKEVAFAASLHKRFAPVVCKQVDDSTVPEPLRRLHFIVCDNDSLFNASMDQLAEALSTDIGWIRKHTEIGALARRWETAGRPGPRGLLLRSPVLEEAEQWLAFHPHNAPEPTPATRDFIRESRKNEDALAAEAKAAAKRKRQLEFALVCLLMLISLAGILYAIWANFSFLRFRVELIAETVWPRRLSSEAERTYAEMTLRHGQVISFQECARCPVMVVIPKGEFMMGSSETEKGRSNTEGPQRKVSIASNFAVGKFEVTFEQWQLCVEASVCEAADDRLQAGGRRPAVRLYWHGAQRYVKWLSQRTGRPYRLLSEAEWEYAARARSTTAYSWGDDVGFGNRRSTTAYSWAEDVGFGNASCEDCAWRDTKNTYPVGSFDANAFGLYDMHGNVSEWLQDCWNGSYAGAPSDGTPWMTGNCEWRVVRGGSWNHQSDSIRSASRSSHWVDDKAGAIGFRLARTLSVKP